MSEKEIVHMACLGALCEPIHIGKNHPKPKVTFRINEVTCPKCIEIMKKQGIKI